MVITHATSVLASTTSGFSTKAVLGVFLAIYAFFFSVEIYQLMLGLAALTAFDMFTGILAAKKTKKEITSAAASRTAYKMAIYGLLISSGHLTDVIVGIPPEWINIEKSMLGFLAATELISILENAGRMGFGVPKKILNQLEKYTD
jgi:phage-related holin